MIFYFSGHESFGNRGCEALCRGTVEILRATYPDAKFYIPTDNLLRDRSHWADHASLGVEFVKAHKSKFARSWKVLQAFFPQIFLRITWPFGMHEEVKKCIEKSDCVIAIGGDNYSLDYFSIPSALIALDQYALGIGKPVILWGASFGPYNLSQKIDQKMYDHIKSMSAVFVRESITFSYATSIGIRNLFLFSDSAFVLPASKNNVRCFLPSKREKGLIGINISPLISRKRYTKSGPDYFCDQIAKFVNHLCTAGYSICLIPHVIPHSGKRRNNDYRYLEDLLSKIEAQNKDNIRVAPPTLNAIEYKSLISGCDFFIGSRTHSTIASLSQCIPTISISYSQKARGINQDIFDSLEWVVPSGDLTFELLLEKFHSLVISSERIQQQLLEGIPKQKKSAMAAGQRLRGLLEEKFSSTM